MGEEHESWHGLGFKLGKMESDMESVKGSYAELRGDIKTLFECQSKHSERSARIEESVSGMEQTLIRVVKSVDNVAATVDSIDKRMTNIEHGEDESKKAALVPNTDKHKQKSFWDRPAKDIISEVTGKAIMVALTGLILWAILFTVVGFSLTKDVKDKVGPVMNKANQEINK